MGERREEKGRGNRRTDLLLNLALFQRSFTQQSAVSQSVILAFNKHINICVHVTQTLANASTETHAVITSNTHNHAQFSTVGAAVASSPEGVFLF